MIYTFANGALGQLAAGITSGATSFALTSGDQTLFPAANFLVLVWNRTDYATLDLALKASAAEFMHVATRSGVNCSGITRAQEGTSAIAHNTSGKSYWAMGVLPASLLNNLALLSFTCPDDSAALRLVPRLVDGVYVPSFEPVS